jgi:hypothetical protein
MNTNYDMRQFHPRWLTNDTKDAFGRDIVAGDIVLRPLYRDFGELGGFWNYEKRVVVGFSASGKVMLASDKPGGKNGACRYSGRLIVGTGYSAGNGLNH